MKNLNNSFYFDKGSLISAEQMITKRTRNIIDFAILPALIITFSILFAYEYLLGLYAQILVCVLVGLRMVLWVTEVEKEKLRSYQTWSWPLLITTLAVGLAGFFFKTEDYTALYTPSTALSLESQIYVLIAIMSFTFIIRLIAPAAVIALYSAYSFEMISNLWASIITVVVVVLYSIYYVVRVQHNPKARPHDRAIAITIGIIMNVIILAIVNMIYGLELFTRITLADDWIAEMKYSVIISVFSFILLPIVSIADGDNRAMIAKDYEYIRTLDDKIKIRLLLYGFLILIVPILVGIILYSLLDPTDFIYYSWILLFYVLVASVMAFRDDALKRMQRLEKLDSILIQILIVIGLVGILTLAFRNFEMADASIYGGAIVEAQMVYEAQGGSNYFSYVFYILMQSQTSAIMIGFMVFGAVAVMVAQNVSDVGQIVGGFATGVVVIIPMLFIFSIFTGGIAAPDLLVEILGSGVAQMVYGLAQTSVFILVVSIIGVFIASGRMLGGMVGR